MLITIAIRQCKSIRLAYIVSVEDVRPARMRLRANHEYAYNEFKQIAQLLKGDPEHFSSIGIFFTAHHSGNAAKDVKDAYAGLSHFCQNSEQLKGDLPTKALVEHFMKYIREKGEAGFEKLLIRPAPRPGEVGTPAQRASSLREFMAGLTPVSPQSVGAPLAPAATKHLETACLQYCTDIQGKVHSGTGVTDKNVQQKLLHLRLLRDFSDIAAVMDYYRTAVAGIAAFVEQKFEDAAHALATHEYVSASTQLCTVSDLQTLQQYAKDHADGPLGTVPLHWQRFAVKIKISVEEMLRQVTPPNSSKCSYSLLEEPLSHLRAVTTAEHLAAFLLRTHRIGFTDALRGLRDQLNAERDASSQKVKEAKFDSKLRALLHRLEGSRVLSPGFVDHANRFEIVMEQVCATARQSIAIFNRHCSSPSALVGGGTSALQALRALNDIRNNLDAHLKGTDTGLLSECIGVLKQFEDLQARSIKTFECQLRFATKPDPSHEGNAAEWAEIAECYRVVSGIGHMFQHMHARLDDAGGNSACPKNLCDDAGMHLQAEIESFLRSAVEMLDRMVETDADATSAIPMLCRVEFAWRAFSAEAVCQKVGGECGRTLDALVARCNSLASASVARATETLAAEDFDGLRDALDIIEKMADRQFFNFASKKMCMESFDGQQTEDIYGACKDLAEKLVVALKANGRQTETLVEKVTRTALLPKQVVEEFVAQFDILDGYEGLFQHLAATAPACEAIMRSVGNLLSQPQLHTAVAFIPTASSAPAQLPVPTASVVKTVADNDHAGMAAPFDGGQRTTQVAPAAALPQITTAAATAATAMSAAASWFLPRFTNSRTSSCAGEAGELETAGICEHPNTPELLPQNSFNALLGEASQFRDTLQQAVIEYSSRCATRSRQSLEASNIADVVKCLSALEEAAVSLDTFLDAPVSPKALLEGMQQTIRNTFNTKSQEASDAISKNTLALAHENISFLLEMNVLEHLFTEISPTGVTDRLVAE
jgi:hypothetical protein